jgi:hypothetical protein
MWMSPNSYYFYWGEFMLIVRFPQGHKPIIISLGHDESIYKQFLISLKTWIGPDEAKNTAAKDDGSGVMVSAAESKKFGFGVVGSEEQLKEVNEKQKGKK